MQHICSQISQKVGAGISYPSQFYRGCLQSVSRAFEFYFDTCVCSLTENIYSSECPGPKVTWVINNYDYKTGLNVWAEAGTVWAAK